MSFRPWLFAVAALLAFAAAPAAANPQAVVKALQERPATSWDLSVARLEAMLVADGIAGNYSGYVTYAATDRDDHELLRIMAWSWDRPATEPACKEILDRLRRLAGVDPETGLPDDPATRFASFFEYADMKLFDIDPTYMETVDELFHVTAVIGVAGDGKAVVCQGPLLSEEVRYSWE